MMEEFPAFYLQKYEDHAGMFGRMKVVDSQTRTIDSEQWEAIGKFSVLKVDRRPIHCIRFSKN